MLKVDPFTGRVVDASGGASGPEEASTNTSAVTLSGSGTLNLETAAVSAFPIITQATACVVTSTSNFNTLTLTANAALALTLPQISVVTLEATSLPSLTVAAGTQGLYLTAGAAMTELILGAGLSTVVITGATNLTDITFGAPDSSIGTFSCDSPTSQATNDAIVNAIDDAVSGGTGVHVTLAGNPLTGYGLLFTVDAAGGAVGTITFNAGGTDYEVTFDAMENSPDVTISTAGFPASAESIAASLASYLTGVLPGNITAFAFNASVGIFKGHTDVITATALAGYTSVNQSAAALSIMHKGGSVTIS